MSPAKRQGGKGLSVSIFNANIKFRDSAMKNDRAVPSAEEAGGLVPAMYER